LVEDRGNIQANVFPEMEIGVIFFFEPDSDLESALTDSLFFTPEAAQSIIDHVNPWSDFGRYDVAP
jgi:hypothetical protein